MLKIVGVLGVYLVVLRVQIEVRELSFARDINVVLVSNLRITMGYFMGKTDY